MTTVSRRCSVLQTVKPVLSGQLMGKSKQLKFHKIKIKPITFDLYLPTFRANSPKELTRSVFTVFFKKRSGVMSFKTYQRLEISQPGVNASQMTRQSEQSFLFEKSHLITIFLYQKKQIRIKHDRVYPLSMFISLICFLFCFLIHISKQVLDLMQSCL